MVGEVDHRHVGDLLQGGDDPLDIGTGEVAEIAGGQDPDPGIEDLQGLGPGRHLALEIGDGAVGDLVQQLAVEGRVLVHHPLGQQIVLGGAALDQIGGQGKGRPGKTDQRHLVGQFLAQDADGVHDVAEIVLGIGDAQRVHRRLAADRGWERPARASRGTPEARPSFPGAPGCRRRGWRRPPREYPPAGG